MRANLVVICLIGTIGIITARDTLSTHDEPPPAEAMVGAPKLVFVGVDAQGGNGDLWPEPGETVNLRVELYNRGDEIATSVFGTLDHLGTNPQVTIVDKTASWPNLAAKGAPQFTSAPHFQIQLGSTLACGARVPFRVSVTTGSGHVFDLDFTVRVGQKVDYDSTSSPGVPRVNEHETTISGAAAGDVAGWSVAWADRNGDGLADPVIGASGAIGGAGRLYSRGGAPAGLFLGLNDLGFPKGTPWSWLDGGDAGDNAGSSLAGGCDVNGDGLDELLVGAQFGDGLADAVLDAGEAFIVYGGGAFVSPTVLEAPHASIAHIWGDDAGDSLSTVGCGDVNGDGYDDVILGAVNADSVAEARADAGEVYLLYGRSTQWTDVNLGAAPAGTFARFSGATAGDALGGAIATGDINGDGFDDIILGVRGGDSILETRASAGEAYVVYGRATAWGNLDFLAAPPAGVVRFWGADPGDAFGSGVASGDLDGDGFDDVVIGANGGASVGNTRIGAGEVTVVYGKPAQWTETDTANPPAGVGIIYGPDADDLFGLEVATGDPNGDGYADIAVGSIFADSAGNGRADAGETTIIQGGRDRIGHVDLLEAPGLVWRFYGRDPGDQSGRRIAMADMSGDGYDEILVGAYFADSVLNGRINAGEAYILYGKPTDSVYGRPDTFSFIDASIGTALPLACDDCSVSVPIGFSFPFYGDERTTVYVGSNGLLSFAPINDLASAVPLCPPTRNPVNDLIAPYWDDLNPEAGAVGSGVFTLLEGTAPNRRLTVEWKDIPHYPAIGAATFEATLFESTGEILFQYQDTTFGNPALDAGAAAVAGVENQKGAVGYAVSCFSGTPVLPGGSAVRLTPTTPLFDSRHLTFFGLYSDSDGLWTSAGGSCEPNDHTPSLNSVYYGQTLSCTYDNGVANAGSLRAATIPDWPADARLEYWFRRQTEGAVGKDLSTIQVSVAGIGGPYVDVAQNTDDTNTWKHSGVNNVFGFAGSSVDLRFRFDTVDAANNAFLGWMVDDVQIFGCDATGVAFGAEAKAYAHPPIYCEQTAGLTDAIGSYCGDGGPPASFQWREGGAIVPGANQLQYTIPASQPPGTYAYSVDITCTGGGSDSSLDADVEIVAKPGVGGSLALSKASGVTQLHFNWTNAASAQDYVVFQDGAASGTFVTQTGTSASGVAGLTVPMPAGNVFYLVTGRNDVCGLGPKQ